MQNGYCYHTEHDSADMIEPGSIQRAGIVLLANLRYEKLCFIVFFRTLITLS